MHIDDHLPPFVHQIVGIAFGIIACAWFTGATSEQVGAIRLPATIISTIYCTAMVLYAAWRGLIRLGIVTVTDTSKSR